MIGPRGDSKEDHEQTRKQMNREWTRIDANKKEETEEPRMDQPSREAMAGKLQIYADRGRGAMTCRGRGIRSMEATTCVNHRAA